MIEQYLNDSIARPELVERMINADLISIEKDFVKPAKKPRKR